MKEVEQATQELIETIKGSRIYKEYREQENNLAANPELLARVDKFRGASFQLQTQANEDANFDLTDYLRQENIELRKIPEVNAYLESELALCKLIQRTCRSIVGSLDFSVPEL